MPRWTIGLLVLGMCMAIIWYFRGSNPIPEDSPSPPRVELLRSDLELRVDQCLYVPGEERPFEGLLVEDFPNAGRKLEIEIRKGKADGYSKGWFDNGQLEVEETFVQGISNGRRTRWYSSGAKRSQADIVNGSLEGVYLEWHENGAQAARLSMKGGVADGLAESWYPTGEPKSRVEYEAGKITKRLALPKSAEAKEGETGSK